MRFANAISGKNRMRKYELFMRTFTTDPETSLLDVGYSNREYSEHENYLEKHYPYPENITALGIMEPGEFAGRYPAVKAVMYDGTYFPFTDKQFDICWSNAVIEHVGGRDRQLLFLREIQRVSRQAYMTTPNRFFPVEVHTKIPLLHWLPKRLLDAVLWRAGKGWATGDYMYLLSRRELESLLREAGITEYTVTPNRLFGFAMDFSIAIICQD